METTLHEGEYILVGKPPLAGNPAHNRVVLFHSPLRQDSVNPPLFISRCVGLPGDTLYISHDRYLTNGQQIPRSPRTLVTYFVDNRLRDEFVHLLQRLYIPQREFAQGSYGVTLSLTPFEEYQLREELSAEANLRFTCNQKESYTLIIPRKGKAYRLDEAALVACREAILRETDGKARFQDGKLYLDGKETAFFFFQQDYYWMLSDNTNSGVDSRHLGFIPADYIVGNALFCWYSPNLKRLFTPVQ